MLCFAQPANIYLKSHKDKIQKTKIVHHKKQGGKREKHRMDLASPKMDRLRVFSMFYW
jgi:hypothetical protein